MLDNLQDLTALLDNATTSVLHFACHNKFTSADGSLVAMADGLFQPSDLSLAVQRRALAASGPADLLQRVPQRRRDTRLHQDDGLGQAIHGCGCRSIPRVSRGQSGPARRATSQTPSMPPSPPDQLAPG